VDALLFCNWLSRREGRRPCYTRTVARRTVTEGGRPKEVEVEEWGCDFRAEGYRLPTEAEWEYACRAGTATAHSFGEEEEELRQYGVFAQSRAAPVAGKMPNGWGLFDTHGNVREWCWDRYQKGYGRGDLTDPTGPATGEGRALRGGSWYDHARACRSAERNTGLANFRDSLAGFRVACGEPAEPAPADRGGEDPGKKSL
jgi:formylglycine-generating enzyme required for sulfatase activity